MSSPSELLFIQGKFKKLRSLLEAQPQFKPDPYMIGALVFTGRVEDAEVYLEKWTAHYSSDEMALNLFFVAVGQIRSSQFEKGKAHLAKAFHLRHEISDSSRIFVFQAFGFYSHLTCRYKKSSYWAKKAWRLSLITDSQFGQILSSDLLAHALLDSGEIGKGFEQLKKAREIALRFGRGSLVTSLEISNLSYQASKGLHPKTIVRSLQKKMTEMGEAKDTYSKANLGLELARQYTLRGQASRAVQLLQSLQAEVFKFGHRRQKSTWYFRFAYIEYLRGNLQAAQDRLSSATSEIDHQSDLAHKLHILGLQHQMDAEENLARVAEIRKLTLRVGSATAIKQYQRNFIEKTKLTEDLLGDLIDEIKNKKISTLETSLKICELGYFQLLKLYFMPPTNTYLLMDILPNALLIFSDGDVEYFPNALTPLLKRMLLFLKTGPKTKKDLIEGLWGYQYDSLRHDQLVHAAINRLRKALGSVSSWVKNENELFILEPKIGVGVFEHSQIIFNPTEAVSENSSPSLNYRQIKILNELKKSEALSIQELVKILKTTKNTVNRDLKGLVDLKLIRTSGRGKSTRYH